MHLDSCTATVMWNDTFDYNIATHEGGAIAIVNSTGTRILLGASKLQNNVALAGGALYGGPGVAPHAIGPSVSQWNKSCFRPVPTICYTIVS